MAKGLDCGTSFYIAATEDTIKKQRNAFLTVDGEISQVKRMLKRQGIPYVEKSGKVHIVGKFADRVLTTTELAAPFWLNTFLYVEPPTIIFLPVKGLTILLI